MTKTQRINLWCGAVGLAFGLVSLNAQAQIYTGDTMTVTVRTGGDDLRGSSRAMIQVQRADGTWSSEKEFSLGGHVIDPWFYVVTCDTSGCQKFPDNTTYTIDLTNWDGLDPCARQIRVRLQQGSCFLCTDDNWNMDWIQVSYSNYAGIKFSLASRGAARLTGSSSSVTFGTNAAPAGTTCRGGAKTVDCSGNLFYTSVLNANPPYHKDDVCDDGGSGFNFMCGAFLFDSGACGVPAAWPAACNGYYEDGECDCSDCGGIWDPDCNYPEINNASRTVWNCGAGQTCINRQASDGSYAPACYSAPIVK